MLFKCLLKVTTDWFHSQIQQITMEVHFHSHSHPWQVDQFVQVLLLLMITSVRAMRPLTFSSTHQIQTSYWTPMLELLPSLMMMVIHYYLRTRLYNNVKVLYSGLFTEDQWRGLKGINWTETVWVISLLPCMLEHGSVREFYQCILTVVVSMKHATRWLSKPFKHLEVIYQLRKSSIIWEELKK